MRGGVLTHWTPQEDEELRLMILAGQRPIEIAAKLHRSKSAVMKRARALGLPFKRIKLEPQRPE
jgi:hypothetical protein